MAANKVEYVVSGCLAGLKCRFDGDSRPCAEVMELVRQKRAIPVCPESMSGLQVPRPPCEQCGGRVISRDGRDLTAEFELGAERALKKSLATGARKAILKSRSPSCGFGEIYDGGFSRKLTSGKGLFAAKLEKAGFEIYSEDNLPEGI